MKSIKNYLRLFVIFLICLIIVSIWFYKGLMFAGGEEGLPFYNLPRSFASTPYVWNESLGGFERVIFLPRLLYFWALSALSEVGFGSVVLQASTIFILMLLGCISTYFLVKETICDELNNKLKDAVPIVASIFYLLNPYSMVQIWGRGIYAQFFAFGLIPLFLLLYILAVKRKKIIYIILGLAASVVLSSAFVFPTQILVLWIPVVLYSVFHMWMNRKNKQEIIFTLGLLVFSGACWLLIQSWWIWPYIKTLGTNVSRLGDIEYNLASLRGISHDSPFAVVVRLIHKFQTAGLYGDSYLSIPFELISWLLPLTLLFSLGTFNNLKHFKFYLCLFIVSFIIVSGANMPFGPVFEWLFRNIPLFQGFRNPYEKSGLLLLIAYTPFFAIGTLEISSQISSFLKLRFPKIIMLTILLLVCVVYVWPMWTGQFAGGIKLNPWVEVPASYRDADDWIRNQDPTARIIHLPLNPGEGVLYLWKHPYRGVEPNEFLFYNPSIGGNIAPNKIYYNVLLERFGVLQKNAFGPDPDITKSEFRSKSLYEELEKLNVRYIVLHHDLDEELSGMKTAEETAQYLAKENDIKKVKTFGLLDIYEVKLPKEIDHVYSPDTKVSFKKLNPAFYTFRVENTNKPIKLYFLETYDPEWELVVDGKKVETHSRVFSYANAWNIDRDGTYGGYIKYRPQDFVSQGWKVTKISLLFLSGFTIINLLVMVAYRKFT